VAGEGHGDEQRGGAHDDEHAQVLHERHEAVVAAELARHRDDPRRAARDHAQRGGRPVQFGRAGHEQARAQAHPERRGAHQHDRDPVVAQRRQRRGLDVGAERDARHGLGGDERRGRDRQPPRGGEGQRQAGDQGAEQDQEAASGRRPSTW
jgi:hypothetical protein